MRSLGRKSFPSRLTPRAILLLIPLSIRMRMHQSLFAHSTKTSLRKSYQKKRKYRKSWRRRFRKPLTVTRLLWRKSSMLNQRMFLLPTQSSDSKFIKYKPSQQSAVCNSGAKGRIIRMVEMPVDPLEPPKFKHKRVPKASGSPPVLVTHSPHRSVTVQRSAGLEDSTMHLELEESERSHHPIYYP